jgi:predicted lipoprotein with Yx(FWY)xxD motif
MRTGTMVAAGAATVALLAGCGSSKSTSSTTSASTGAAAPAAAKSAYGSSASATGGSSATGTSAAGASSTALIGTKHNALGTVLAAGPKKLTVYMFEGDGASSSRCSAACASVWPPVTSTGAARTAGGAMTSHLGLITRPDGKTQVTYNGHPLYLFARDKDHGDSYGQGIKSFGSAWYVLAPNGNKIDKS